MKNTIVRYAWIGYAIVVGMVINHAQLALAGWTGAMNGIGVGQASVNVKSSELKSRTASTTNNMPNPSVAMTITTGYVFGSGLPEGASIYTVAKIKGSAGYVWQATTVGSNGDSTDEAELEGRVTIIAADCASLEMETSSEIDSAKKSGTITVNVKGTAGTAFWTRGFELLEGQVPPEDDPNTPENEFIEFLKANGNLKWDVLNVGPLDQNVTNCTALKIPFSYETDISNLYSVSQGVAKSLPLEIKCPNDILVDCQQPVTYPETVLVGGCGNITVSFDPLIPPVTVGTHPIKVTATDKDGNTTNCTFNVIVTDTTAPVPNVANLPDVTGQCSATITTAPKATDNCGGTIITGTTTDLLTRTTQGTSTVTWKFDDGHGNVSTQTQKIIVADTNKPVITATGTPPDGVLGVNPTAAQISAALGTATATDNCGPVTPTVSTSSVTTNFCSYSQTRTWNVTDAAGNVAPPVSRTVTWSPGFTFTGFYSPINGTNGTCAAPLITKTTSSTLPIKFDMKCGTTLITGGSPPVVHIQPYDTNCVAGAEIVVANAVYQNDWHYNWNVTNRIGGTYKVTVDLPDGTSRYVFVKLK